MLWYQKLRSQWIKLNDRNNKYIHTTVLICHEWSKIQGLLRDDEEWMWDNEEMKYIVLGYFTNWFKQEREFSVHFETTTNFPV